MLRPESDHTLVRNGVTGCLEGPFTQRVNLPMARSEAARRARG
jgi:hypothetical protein